MSRAGVSSGDALLSVLIEGEAGKPWLVLSNSLGADLHMWDEQMPLLTRTHRVIRYDTRGHGQSSAPEGAYSFDMLVGDMVAVLDHAGAESADVMGLSLGGMTALGLALGHPGRVGRMVVCDARADNPSPFVASWDDRIAAIRAGGMEAVVEGTLARWFSPDAPQPVRARAAAMIRATSAAGYIGCARALQGLSYFTKLGNITAPVLYLVGAEDMGAPKDVMAAMAAATPGAQFVALPGLAHVPNMEAPDAFNAAIGPWLARAGGAA